MEYDDDAPARIASSVGEIRADKNAQSRANTTVPYCSNESGVWYYRTVFCLDFSCPFWYTCDFFGLCKGRGIDHLWAPYPRFTVFVGVSYALTPYSQKCFDFRGSYFQGLRGNRCLLSIMDD